MTNVLLTSRFLHGRPKRPCERPQQVFKMSLLHRIHRDRQENVQSTRPGVTSSEQNGVKQSSSRVPRRRSSGLKFFTPTSVPKPEISRESHKTWETEYLQDLRANRPARPGGSRPLPERTATAIPEPYVRASSAMSFMPSASTRQIDITPELVQDRCASAFSHRKTHSYMPGVTESSGRPMIRPPKIRDSSRDMSAFTTESREASIVPSGSYMESGMRWMEKQEARSLREALEDMDLREEAKIHAAAQDEASELVLKHRSGGGLARDPFEPYNYKQHLEKGAHARSQSIGWTVDADTLNTHHDLCQQSDSSRSTSGGSSDHLPPSKVRSTTITFEDPPTVDHENKASSDQTDPPPDTPQKKIHASIPSLKFPSKLTGRRRSSGPRARNVSGGLFRNPDDKIYEEPDNVQEPYAPVPPETTKIPAPLISKPRNSVPSTSLASPRLPSSRVGSTQDKPRVYRSEIHRNPPSQSRDPSYRKNADIATPPDAMDAGDETETPQFQDGREIRSDDIKAATSMRMKDRSPKLPSPTVVSDRPGRPIVSFDQNWKPRATNQQGDESPTRPSAIPPRMRSKAPQLHSTSSAPVIPTINVPDQPSISINDTAIIESPSLPTISVSQAPISSASPPKNDAPAPRPLPTISSKPRPSPANRPLPHHSSTTPVLSSKLHWSPSSRRATAQCAACALPIEGRIVSAASQRFHPHCFTCHHCTTALECVAFYPEPDLARDDRLARAVNRQEDGEDISLEDSDPTPRFYCHLDFHELFSPRCRSCKTPIESEVVLACGGTWHVGHFFCAQCGDPFDAKTPFVERDGYAWCVGCHAGRFSGKCKGCRRPVVEGGVMALEGEWHEECFCCVVSLFRYRVVDGWMV